RHRPLRLQDRRRDRLGGYRRPPLQQVRDAGGAGGDGHEQREVVQRVRVPRRGRARLPQAHDAPGQGERRRGGAGLDAEEADVGEGRGADDEVRAQFGGLSHGLRQDVGRRGSLFF
ncbi:hypothetical protein THAOC_14980, partial [Thalassiosira oceanica]